MKTLLTSSMASEPRVLEIEDARMLEPFEHEKHGEWNAALASHLARRSGLGASAETVAQYVAMGPRRSVRSLFEDAPEKSASAQLRDAAMSVNSIGSAQSWWILEMLTGPRVFREKVALFWHGHFATLNAKVGNARLMLGQLDLLRSLGLGDFERLVQALARDPAMLLWLDSNLNRVGKPNENFGRELMELFTLGIGNYTEGDIKEAARAFTGWHVRGTEFWFNERAHDAGPKMLFGESTVRTGEEVVSACVRRRESARFIATKLFRFFVHPAPGEKLDELLADVFVASGRHTGRYLERLLSSRLFYSEAVRRSIIASPVDYAIGTLRALGARAAPSKLVTHLRDMGQALLQPPSVKGWDGGRSWVNSTTVLARLRFALDLAAEKPLGARIDWERVAGDEPVEGLVATLFPGGVDEALTLRLSDAVGRDEPGRVLAAITQLPEYQVI